LASEFDRMLDRLESSRRAQRNAARMSGRSAVATTVMHGIGNIVNSVNVSASMAADSISQVDLADLRAIEAALREHEGGLDDYLANHPQGQHLLGFLSATIETCGTRIESASLEVESMLGSVEEVKGLVSSLEKEEMHESVHESIRLADEVEDALARSGLRETSSGTVCKLFLDSTLEMKMDPHHLSEILDAVLENAGEALAEVPAGERKIQLRLSRAGDLVRFSVEDSGEGIEAERLESLFEMRETTRGEGRGKGLHMAALAARALGGELHAWSAGRGEGAIFTLEIPLKMGPQHVVKATREEPSSSTLTA
ncbi:MAG: ATP-binding protein, partial [Planctomycetota bacterium]